MTKRPSLRANVAPIEDEAAAAVEHVAQLQARHRPPAAAPAPAEADRTPYTTSTIHLPQELLEALQQAALRRAARKRRADPKGRGGRASVSEIVVELLDRHRGEFDGLE